MATRVAGLIGAGLLAGCAAPTPAPTPDLAALMRGLAAAPYRYGGELSGTVPGLEVATASGVRAPVHMAVGLDAPDAEGRLHGRAILFGASRRFLAEGPVSGRIDPGFSPGTASCDLTLALPTGPVALSGICTANTLSGEVVERPAPPDLLTRVVSWWGDRAVAGRYWLDRDSFDPAA